MKLAIIFLAVLGLACGKPLSTGGVQEQQQELPQNAPIEKVLQIVLDYLYYDKEVKEFVVNIQSEEFPRIHTFVEYLKEYQDCFQFINENGVDVYAIIKQVYDTLRFPPYEPTNTTRKGVGFRGLIEDVIEVLPLDELKAIYEKETEIRECLKTLFTAIQSPVFRKMVNSLRDWPEYEEIRDYLRRKGVDVDPYMEHIRTLYSLARQGIQYLQEDITEFMALVPPHKFFEIAREYLAYDPEVKEFAAYIQSEKFPYIHKPVEYLKQNKPCLKHIDVYAIINKVYDTLGLPPFEPTNTTRTGVGFLGMKDDMIAVFPLEDLNAFFENKMETREYYKPLLPAYKTLVKTIQSPVFKKIVDTVRTRMVDTVRPMMVDLVRNWPKYWPEYQKQFEMLREKYFNKDRIIEQLRKFREQFLQGIHYLQEDITEFMALVPPHKFFEISKEYLAYDPEVQEFVAYIQSEKFPYIHKPVEYLKQFKPCLKLIDVYAIINKIYDTLGLPPFEPTNTTRMGVGFNGLKDDMIAVFPLEDLNAFFEKKMETREYYKPLLPAYKTLVKTIQSPVFKKTVDTVRAWMVDTVRPIMVEIVQPMVVDLVQYIMVDILQPMMVNHVQPMIVDLVQNWPKYWSEYQKQFEMLREKYLNKDRIVEQLGELRDLFLQGMYILKEDLQELNSLLPTEKVLIITLDYIAYDPELQELLDYIQSEKFPIIHNFVGYLKGYKDRLQFIDDRGVNIYAIVKIIYDTLGYPLPEPTNTTHSGIQGLMQNVIASFPLEDLNAFVEKKMETREYYKPLLPVYKTLVKTIQSPVLKKVVETVRARMVDTVRPMMVELVRNWPQYWPEFQKQFEMLRENVFVKDRVIELLREIRELLWQGAYILKDDLQEFMPLVPAGKVSDIILVYLAYDPEVQEFLDYIQSEEFPVIHNIVEYLKGYKDRLQIIDDHGVNINAIVKIVYDTLGYSLLEPTNTTNKGIQGLKQNVIAAFPLEELKAFVVKKIETRPYFRTMVSAYKTLVTTIQSPEFRNMVNTVRSFMVDTVRSWPEYQEVVEMLREKVFDVNRTIELLRDLNKRFWQGAYILMNDLQEFMNLVPTDKVLDITMDYLTYDPEVQEFLDYIQSEEFPMIHNIVEYLKGYKDLLPFINDHGVDFFAIIKQVHDTLGYPPFEPTNTTRTGVGFRGLIHDMIAAFPLNELKAFVENKLETRQYFKILVTVYKTLVATLQSPEFREMVNTVRAFMLDTLQAITEHQRLLEILHEMGVDVDRIIELLRKLFSWTPF